MMTRRETSFSSGNKAKVSLTGGRAIAEMVRLVGTRALFGMGGFQLLTYYDAIRELELKHKLVNDERTAAFAADAYARVTNCPGICDATLGPGATNLVTGLVESTNAGIPIVALIGDTNRNHSWKNMTQEARQVEILRPAVKDLIRIETPARVPELLRRAISLATSGRPGAVVVDVPEDVAHATCDYNSDDFWVDAETLETPARRFRPDAEAVASAAALIERAKRPVLLVGGGIHLSRAYEALRKLSEGLNIPVAHTMSGKGGIPCTHPLNAGLFGRYSRFANDLIEASDLLIVVGCKMGEIPTKRYQLPSKPIPMIHLEILPEEIGRTMPADFGLVGDARAGLEDICTTLSKEMRRKNKERDAYATEVKERMKRWQSEVSLKLNSDETPVSMARLITELNKVMPEDGILIGDGGFAGHWTGLLWNTKRAGRTYIADRGFASIGYGLPAALGAQLAAPDQPVVAITGDAGFNMTIGDLETARRSKVNVILVIVNNAASGYVKALQHTMLGGRYQSSDLVEMDYASIARAMGCRGIRVERPDQLAGAFREALAGRDQTTIIDVMVTRDPAKMLPGVDSRTAKIQKGDRIA